MRALFSSCLASLALVGCWGIIDSGDRDGIGGRDGMSQPGPDAGATAHELPPTLDTICARLAPAICEMSQNCCFTSGIGYDASGCESQALAECEANVAEVRAGTMRFDPSLLNACLAQYQTLYARCYSSATDTMTIVKELEVCASMFAGSLPQEAPCERREQCARSNEPNT